jgi:hypothetical protein
VLVSASPADATQRVLQVAVTAQGLERSPDPGGEVLTARSCLALKAGERDAECDVREEQRAVLLVWDSGQDLRKNGVPRHVADRSLGRQVRSGPVTPSHAWPPADWLLGSSTPLSWSY